MIKYIISEEEAKLLERYEGTINQRKDPYRYDALPQADLAMLLRLKDRTNDIFLKRIEAAREVIDLVAAKVGIDLKETGFFLYAPDPDGSSPILARIEEWLNRGGDKAKLKRRLTELEQENETLRSLIVIKS